MSDERYIFDLVELEDIRARDAATEYDITTLHPDDARAHEDRHTLLRIVDELRVKLAALDAYGAACVKQVSDRWEAAFDAERARADAAEAESDEAEGES
jgi:hypothetical protein